MINRNLKGAVPIRSFFIASIIMAMLIYPIILMVGYYSQANNLALNASVGTIYNGIVGNQSNPTVGLFGNYTGLYGQTSGTASTLHNANQNFGLFNTIAAAAQFISSLPSIANAILAFIAVPFQALGIPTGFSLVIAYTLVIGLFVLAIVSAIFLFPT